MGGLSLPAVPPRSALWPMVLWLPSLLRMVLPYPLPLVVAVGWLWGGWAEAAVVSASVAGPWAGAVEPSAFRVPFGQSPPGVEVEFELDGFEEPD
ncbi:hypothetical protein, partial [Kribbella sp. NPDC006257]|uniref:hypothetical protein n=1 Tax=Kribbella sp. NPDC006257 TaxID=3156738 RepID=UPI0033A807B2